MLALTGSFDFENAMIIIIKPTYTCNFRCKYCYLSNVTKTHSSVFNIDFAKEIVRQIKDIHKKAHQNKITIIWHGGEPLLWGKVYFRVILDYIQQELFGFDVKNTIQTNLSLIDEEYLGIFSQHNVGIGFSLDGTKEIHDQQRVFTNNKPTFDVIMEKLALCRKWGINPGCIVVGSRKHIGRVPQLYQFMKEHEINFKFNPLFISGEALQNRDQYSITAQEYAQMSIELFDLWFDDSEGKIKESNFVEIASNIATRKVCGCAFRTNCQDNFFAIAPTGDVMPCGRFCDDDLLHYSYGNLHKETLSDILPRIKQSEIYKRSEYIEKGSCKHCKWLDICHGGCLHDGFLKSGDFRSKTFLCSAYKKIFAHIEKRMREVNVSTGEYEGNVTVNL